MPTRRGFQYAYGDDAMNVGERVRAILDETLGLEGRSASWDDSMGLLGNVPELTSMAIVEVLLSLEEQFEITVADDEMDAESFGTVGTLTRFIESKLS